ncbi:hypothetical protein HDV01_003589 [Terramyces sp. JEL0728]|nr:hypothetical protein HDV01_003589 [Terramyces sp. JEL0728]
MDEFQADTLVWAKVKGYSWWPAKVETEQDLPPFALAAKPPKPNHIPIYFFGTREFGWVTTDCLKTYQENFDDLHKKCKTKPFLLALDEIKDKNTWPVKHQYDDFDPDQESKEKKKRKSLPAPKEDKKETKRRKSMPAASAEKKLKLKPIVISREKLLRLRKKLQLFLQQEQYTEKDYKLANEYLVEAEKITIDLDLFKETKIGKVVKRLGRKGIKEYSISERCTVLTERWIKQVQGSLSMVQDGDLGILGDLNSPVKEREEGDWVVLSNDNNAEKEDMEVDEPKKTKNSPKKSDESEEISSPEEKPPRSPKKGLEVPKSPKDIPKSPEKETPKSPKNDIPKSPKKAAGSPKAKPLSPIKPAKALSDSKPSSPKKDAPISPSKTIAYGNAANAWFPPLPGQTRSPCPGLNSLANHGYLPRDGNTPLTPDMLITAFKKSFNADVDLINFIVNAATQAGIPQNFTLGQLNVHNAIEHDASLTRQDCYFGNCSKLNIKQFTNFMAHVSNGHSMTMQDMVNVRHNHFNYTIANNPTYLLGPTQYFLAYGEASLIHLFFGKAPSWEVPVDFLIPFFLEERLPLIEGWSAPASPVHLSDVLALISTLQMMPPTGK